MPSITVTMKDGTKREFPHAGRGGGSYTKSAEYKQDWLIITDEWGKRVVIPSSEIAEVEECPMRRDW